MNLFVGVSPCGSADSTVGGTEGLIRTLRRSLAKPPLVERNVVVLMNAGCWLFGGLLACVVAVLGSTVPHRVPLLLLGASAALISVIIAWVPQYSLLRVRIVVNLLGSCGVLAGVLLAGHEDGDVIYLAFAFMALDAAMFFSWRIAWLLGAWLLLASAMAVRLGPDSAASGSRFPY